MVSFTYFCFVLLLVTTNSEETWEVACPWITELIAFQAALPVPRNLNELGLGQELESNSGDRALFT